ncbi:TniQ family protein [Paraburkholderia ginsengiterrae]|uniref:TniQ family protein n=1 Tax=Paraburkholderia ginsengiterrae TaxID=1462993 RepID=UPI0009ED0149|nr:TniQ family protein [Paraburkholderia ginsengiterrae]
MQPAASSSLPRSGASPRTLSFPILTLDERKLTPALGYVFNRKWLDPCESLISILWKFERANALPGHIVARLMGPDVHPYEGIVPELGAVNLERLRENLPVPVRMLRVALLQPSQRRRYSNVFRHCRHCVAHGYHSVLHQLESISACPAHHRALETACRRCGYEAPYRVSVRLLEAPYRCASCRASYGGQGWTPNTPLMKAEYRKAFTRRYFERYLG